MRMNRNWGMTLLAVWLIVYGAMFFLNISFVNMGAVMAILALVAGICLLLGK
jgi:hypothetical protein